MPVMKDPKTNTWYIRTYIKDENGKSKQITRRNKEWTGRAGHDLALQKERRLRNGTDDELVLKKENKEEELEQSILTYEDVFLENLTYKLKKHRISISTYKTILRRNQLHILPEIGNIDIHELTIQKYVKLQNKLRKNGNSLRYINSMHCDVFSTLKYAMIFHKLDCNVAQMVGPLFEDRDDVKSFMSPEDMLKIDKEASISPEEWENIVEYLTVKIAKEKNVFNKIFCKKELLLYLLEYTLYMRIGEIQALTYDKVFLEESKIFLNAGYSKDAKKIVPLKTRKTRFVYFNDTIKLLFKEIQEEDKKYNGINEKSFIFGYTKHFSRTSIRNRLQIMKNELGITKILHNHKCRHSGISTSLYNGADPTSVARTAGHSLKMTLEVYNQGLEKANQELVELQNKMYMPNLMNAKQDQKQDQSYLMAQ